MEATSAPPKVPIESSCAALCNGAMIVDCRVDVENPCLIVCGVFFLLENENKTKAKFQHTVSGQPKGLWHCQRSQWKAQLELLAGEDELDADDAIQKSCNAEGLGA